MEETIKIQQRKLDGIVTSNKMQKTLVVSVTRLKKHPKYKKYQKITKKYYAHYEEGNYLIGDKVTIKAGNPMSKTKRWVVVNK